MITGMGVNQIATKVDTIRSTRVGTQPAPVAALSDLASNPAFNPAFNRARHRAGL